MDDDDRALLDRQALEYLRGIDPKVADPLCGTDAGGSDEGLALLSEIAQSTGLVLVTVGLTPKEIADAVKQTGIELLPEKGKGTP